MPEKLPIIFDPLKCTGCALCVPGCPTFSIDVSSGKARPRGNLCLRCGHCQAICPAGAISGALLAPFCTPFETFSPDPRWLPAGAFDLVALVRLMASRRSIRRFTPKSVDPALLRDLVRIGITAPSATNCQSWTFTILPDSASVLALSHRTAAVYRRLCRQSGWWTLRTFLRLLGKPDLDNFYRGYRSFILARLDEWGRGGCDPFFRGASAAIIIGARSGGGAHSDDAHMAAQNIILAAHAMGLGTCLIGLSLVAFRHDSSVAAALDLPRNETVHSVIAIGYPDEHFLRLTGRAEPEIRVRKLSDIVDQTKGP